MLRKLLFWSHLVAGLVAGLIVLVLSVTGVLLTYEAQIEDWAIARSVEAPEGAAPLDADALVAAVQAGGAQPGQALILPREAGDPAKLQVGRNATAIDPYTGATMPEAGASVQALFHDVERFHRWLSTDGSTDVGGTMVDLANLAFVFLIATGLYLWIPPVFRWVRIRSQLFFRRGLPNAQARDYNWHHVFGIWALVPIFLIALSGVVISYPWASRMVYTVVGEEAPQGRGRPPAGAAMPERFARETLDGAPVSYVALIEGASAERPDWKRATLVLPEAEAGYVAVTLDAGNGVQTSKQAALVLDRASGEVATVRDTTPTSRGAALRRWFRFVHTGQVYGLLGQTIAGVASAAAAVLVYTGMALGIRRLGRMARRRRVA